MSPIHDTAARRFILRDDDGEASLSYEREAGVVVVTHTFVPPQWRGRGVAEKLMRAALAWIDSGRLRVASRCSYATAFLARHSEFAHLLAEPPR